MFVLEPACWSDPFRILAVLQARLSIVLRGRRGLENEVRAHRVRCCQTASPQARLLLEVFSADLSMHHFTRGRKTAGGISASGRCCPHHTSPHPARPRAAVQQRHHLVLRKASGGTQEPSGPRQHLALHTQQQGICHRTSWQSCKWYITDPTRAHIGCFGCPDFASGASCHGPFTLHITRARSAFTSVTALTEHSGDLLGIIFTVKVLFLFYFFSPGPPRGLGEPHFLSFPHSQIQCGSVRDVRWAETGACSHHGLGYLH